MKTKAIHPLSLAAALLVMFVAADAAAQLRLMSQEESQGRLPLLAEIDFEDVPLRARSPLTRQRVTFTDFVVRNCASPTCVPDSDNTNNANRIFAFAPRIAEPNADMSFAQRPRFVVLDLQGAGVGLFTVRVTEANGKRHVVQEQTLAGRKLLGLEAVYGISRIDVTSFDAAEGSDRLGVAAVFVHTVQPPSPLVAKPVWSTQVNLTWKDRSDTDTSLSLERSVGSRSNYVEIANLPPDQTSYTDAELTPRTRYFYRIRSNHPNGESAYSNEATITTGVAGRALVLRSIGAEDGYVCEDHELFDRGGLRQSGLDGPDALIAGDLAGDQQCKAIVSFNTAQIPDSARIVAARLTLTQGVRVGDPSTLGPLHVDINRGPGLGGSPDLRPVDFTAPANIPRVAVLQPSGGGHVANLNRLGLAQINKTGRTQFRIHFTRDDNDNSRADYIGWYSGENANPENRPVLEIFYQPVSRGTNQVTNIQ